MHPNHLCVEPRSNTTIACPFETSTSLGLCDWVVGTFIFRTFSCSPISSKHVTSSSPVRPQTFFAKRRISSANLRSKSVRMPLWKFKAALPTFRRQHPKATSRTHGNNRGLNTHPCHTPPLIQHGSPSVLLSSMRPLCHNKCIAKPTTYDRTLVNITEVTMLGFALLSVQYGLHVWWPYE